MVGVNVALWVRNAITCSSSRERCIVGLPSLLMSSSRGRVEVIVARNNVNNGT